MAAVRVVGKMDGRAQVYSNIGNLLWVGLEMCWGPTQREVQYTGIAGSAWGLREICCERARESTGGQ